MKVENYFTTFQEIAQDKSTPKTLYKFRDWSNDKHKRLLVQREAYFSAPCDFIDPFDFRIPVRYDRMTDIEKFKWACHVYESKYPGTQKHIITSEAAKLMQQPHMSDKSYFRNIEEEFLNDQNNRLGVLSLSGNLYNTKLWSLYASEFKGFAVGLDPLIIFPEFGGGGPVIYGKKLPILKPEPIMDFHVIKFYQVHFKFDKWDWEEEYRTMIFKPKLTINDRRKVLPSGAFKEIWVGYKMPKEDLEQLKKLLHPDLKHLPIRVYNPSNS